MLNPLAVLENNQCSWTHFDSFRTWYTEDPNAPESMFCHQFFFFFCVQPWDTMLRRLILLWRIKWFEERNRFMRQHQRREVKEGSQGVTLKHQVEHLCLNFCLCDDRKRQLPGSAIRDHSNYVNRSNIYGCCVLKSVDT